MDTYIKTKIIQRHATSSEWIDSTYVPLKGELIIYDVDETHELPRVKIGDGATPINDLPFTITQADLAENDPTSAAYVKNRLLYEETTSVDVVPETTFTFTDNQYIVYGEEWAVQEGKTYIVRFDDAEYECICKSGVYNDMPCLLIGNVSLINSSAENTQEPFVVGVISGVGSGVFVADTETSHKVAVINNDIVYHRLPKEYLPEGYGYFNGEALTLLPETDLMFTDDYQAWGVDNIAELMREGKEYTVTINGVEYTGVAMAHNLMGFEVTGFGNQVVVGGENTGEPFFAATGVMNGNSLFAIFDLTGATAVKASLVKYEEEAVLFDERLIGDWVARKKLGTVELLPEITFEWIFDEDGGDYNYLLNQPILLEIGKEYKVVLNGNTYQCIGTDTSSQVPNACYLDVGGQLWVVSDGMNTTLIENEIDANEPATIAIYTEGETPNKIPAEYLPKGYGYFGDVKTEVEKILVPETSVEISDATGRYMAETDSPAWVSPLSFESGKVYKVLFDDVGYSCAAHVYSDEGIAWLGNMGAFDSTMPNTGEPFLYLCSLSGDIDGTTPVQIRSEEARGKTVSLSIYTETEVTEVTKFNGRLMPNGLGYLEGEDSVTVTNTLTFNGNMTDKVNFTLDNTNYFVKITDSPVEISLLYGATIEGYGQQAVITEDICQDMSAQVGVPCYFAGDYVVICYEDGFFMGYNFPKGIYVTNTPNVGYVSSIKALTDCFTIETRAIPHLIDERLIGDWVARKEEQEIEIVPEMEAELSTTTMTAGFNEGEQGHCALSLDKTYNFTFKGVEYKGLKATEINDGTHLILQVATSDFNYNYFVSGYDTLDGMCSLASTSEDDKGAIVTFSIAEAALAPVKIPEEYLPDVPTFDLTELGLDNLIVDGEISVMPLYNSAMHSAIYSALKKGKAKFRLKVNSTYTVIDCSIAEYGTTIMGYQCTFFTTQAMNPESLIGIILDFDGDASLSARAFTVNNTAPVDSVIINSSTESSNETYRLTVDDDGIPYVTNVNESTGEKLVTETIMKSNIESYINEALLGGAW